MPYAVAAIGVLTFLSGLSVGGGRYVSASFLVAAAVAVALWLRTYVLTTIEQAFEKGAGYGESTRYRLRHLPEVHEVADDMESVVAKMRATLNGDPPEVE